MSTDVAVKGWFRRFDSDLAVASCRRIKVWDPAEQSIRRLTHPRARSQMIMAL